VEKIVDRCSPVLHVEEIPQKLLHSDCTAVLHLLIAHHAYRNNPFLFLSLVWPRQQIFQPDLCFYALECPFLSSSVKSEKRERVSDRPAAYSQVVVCRQVLNSSLDLLSSPLPS
jgi:hypothetical protein